MVYILGGLGIASDIAQLTSFNLLDYLNTHSPQSFYLLIIGTLLLYFALVFIEFIRNKPNQQSTDPEHYSGQIIKTHNIKNSTIIQIKNGKED